MSQKLNDENLASQTGEKTAQADAHDDLPGKRQGLGRSEKISTSVEFLLKKHADVLNMFRGEK